MILRLSADDIVSNWDQIRYGALSVNLLPDSRTVEYTTNLLAKLISGDAQCWFAISEDDKIKAMSITRILKDVGDIAHLLIDTVFGYLPTTLEEKKEFYGKMVQFGRQLKCENVVTWTANSVAMNAAEKAGLSHTHNIYSIRIGGQP